MSVNDNTNSGTVILSGDTQDVEQINLATVETEQATVSDEAVVENTVDNEELTQKMLEFLTNFKINDESIRDLLNVSDSADDNTDNDEQEAVDLDLNSMVDEHDFLIVLKTHEKDVHFIAPQLNNFNDLSEDERENIAQNHFMLGFINFAINNEEWVNEYSKHLQEQSHKNFDEMLEGLGLMSDIKNMSAELNENINLDDKMIDFQAAVEKLNSNKPKIIT